MAESSAASTLTEEELDRAHILWDRGLTLGEIAETLGCSVYALTPWLTSEERRGS